MDDKWDGPFDSLPKPPRDHKHRWDAKENHMTTEAREVMERLRRCGHFTVTAEGVTRDRVFDEACDLIARLLSENAALREVIRQMRDSELLASRPCDSQGGQT